MTWSTNAAAIATVTTSGVVTAVTAGSATITATVDTKTGSAQVTVSAPAPLVVDPVKAVNDSIGPSGGTLTTTGANGVVFTLTIPPHALVAPERITMTPVKSMGRLPFSGGFFGGVDRRQRNVGNAAGLRSRSIRGR